MRSSPTAGAGEGRAGLVTRAASWLPAMSQASIAPCALLQMMRLSVPMMKKAALSPVR
jgi:hypothetical protein